MESKKKAILKNILTQINNGGMTYNLSLNNDYAGTKNISVNPLPERSKILAGRATAKMITNYCDENSDLFKKYKKLSLGAWYDETIGKTWLDITTPIPLEKMSEAIILGKKANQKAIFDLYDSTETQLGGTGIYDPLVVTTAFEERLEEALMLMGEEENKENEKVDYAEELESIPEKDEDGIEILP